jgi:hypothetical protein
MNQPVGQRILRPSHELRQRVRLAVLSGDSAQCRARIMATLIDEMTAALTAGRQPGEVRSAADITAAATRHLARTREWEDPPASVTAPMLDGAVQERRHSK